MAKGSTATTCPTRSVSTISLILILGCVTYSSWVRSARTGFLFSKYSPLGEIVDAAGGDYTSLSIGGGVVAVQIQWICNLDFDFMENCLPK